MEIMTFWEGVFISSIVWVNICYFAFLRGMDWSFDNRTNWGEGFNSGWDAALEVVQKMVEERLFQPTLPIREETDTVYHAPKPECNENGQ